MWFSNVVAGAPPGGAPDDFGNSVIAANRSQIKCVSACWWRSLYVIDPCEEISSLLWPVLATRSHRTAPGDQF